jgi:hypothetical protein
LSVSTIHIIWSCLRRWRSSFGWQFAIERVELGPRCIDFVRIELHLYREQAQRWPGTDLGFGKLLQQACHLAHLATSDQGR